MHINKFNEVLHNQKLKLDIENRRLSQTTHAVLNQAIESSCFSSFLKCKKRVSRFSEYELIAISENHVRVKIKKYVNAIPGYCYRKNDDMCFTCKTCESSIAYEEQCENSLVANNEEFIISQFDKRHMRRDECEGSYPKHMDDASLSDQSSVMKTQSFLEDFFQLMMIPTMVCLMNLLMIKLDYGKPV